MSQNDKTLALVIDIQERLMPVLHEAERFAADSAKLIQGLHLLDVPLLLTEQYPKGLGATIDTIKHALPEHTPCFEKTRFSAYTPEVQAAIAAAGAEHIILLGCETHICMLQTARDLRRAGIRVSVAQECLTSRTPENKANGIQQMQQLGVCVSNIESLLFDLLQDAKHPQFKAVSKLIQ